MLSGTVWMIWRESGAVCGGIVFIALPFLYAARRPMQGCSGRSRVLSAIRCAWRPLAGVQCRAVAPAQSSVLLAHGVRRR